MPVKKRETKENRFIKTFREYGEHTSFHGVKYIVSRDNTIYEKYVHIIYHNIYLKVSVIYYLRVYYRILWAIVVLLCFAGAVYMTMIFWNRFSSNPIRITIQSGHKHTSIITFPGVTICTAVRQVPEKVDRLLANL